MQMILALAAVTAFQTTGNGTFTEVRTVPPTREEAWQTPVLDLDAAQSSHPYLGLGGGLGDASCKLLSELPPDRRRALLEDLFTEKGLNLSIARIQVGANDYSTEVYTYDEGDPDPELKRFSIDRDRQWILPTLREVADIRKDIFFLASPWTPPGWMKTNGGLFGGWMKSEWIETYSDYCLKFVAGYRDAGVNVQAFTVQNEPECQRGGSPTCLWHPEQEAKMAKLLRARLDAAGFGGTRIWLWDHNYDGYRRVLDQLTDAELLKAVDAVAWHPYCGEPSMLDRVRVAHPALPFHQTEFGPNIDPALGRDLAFWGKTVIGALRHGCSSFLNFCLVLDENGYPNTSQGLGCGGFVELDVKAGTWTPSAQYRAFRHIAPFVRRGAKILNCAWNDPEGGEAVAFENPDGTKVVVFAVPGENPHRRRQVQFKADGAYHVLSVPEHSITTFVLKKDIGTSLEEAFRRPPASARPWTWWHWMDGHVSKEGITADLEAMRDIGLGGATVFDVTAGLARGPVDFGTEAWFGALGHAVREAHRLGLEIQVPNCSGYSSSGGPWVKPEQGMKFVVHTETRADGPRRFDETLPAPPNPHGFYADIAVLAFPVPPGEGEPLRAECAEQTFAGDAGGTVAFASSEPFEATGVSFVLTGGGQWNEPARFAVAYSEDGVTWRDGGARDFDVRRSGSGSKGLRYYPFSRAVRGKRFRITFSFPPEPSSPGYVPGYVGRFTVRDAALERRAALSDLDGKTFRIRQDIRRDGFAAAPGQVVALSSVTNLTHLLRPDGRLAWDVPDGRWAILRVGFAANGERNHPVSGGGSGLEVDKLDRAALDAHFDAYVERLCARLGPDLVGQGKSALSGILVDSYEVGSQNWTQGFERTFRRRRGYDLVPWLALLSGRVVGSVAESERVLGDWRATVAELFAENYADALAGRCRARGLQFGVECYGNGPFNALEYGRSADIPMCEFWAKRGNGVVNSTAVGGEGCARLAASVAHVNGRRLVGAESFTAFPADGKWQADPFSLKAQADRVFARGVNRLYFHRYAHQPWTAPTRLPGMTMGAWGTHFERTVTWWRQGRDFIAYLARVQFLLQAGESVADCLMTTGTETPDGGGDAQQATAGWPQPPEGYDWDWCTRRQAESAALRARYAVVAQSSEEAAEKLRAAGLEPDFVCETPDVVADVAWCHRRYAEGVEAYFVACGVSDRPVELACAFRQARGEVELWDAETGEVRRARRVSRQGGRTRVTLALKPSGSVFVVFRPSSAAPLEGAFETVRETSVAGPWTVTLGERTRVWTNLVDWAASDDPEIRHFSGTGAYEATVRLPACGKGERLVLDLGGLRNLAEVFVDSRRLPTLWRPPFRCALPAGPARTVRLRVEVTNLWPNRLIGDDFLSADAEYAANGGLKSIPAWVTEGRPSPAGRTTFTTWKHWTKGDRPLPSGLFGPVRLVTERAR